MTTAPLSRTTAHTDLPVVVVGAGPIGLAAAAHLTDRALPVVVLESGADVGAAVSEWAHIRTFTPWEFIVDPTAERLLATAGWTRPTAPAPPTGAELVEQYLRPLGALVGGALRLGHRVLAVTREGMDKTRTVGRSERPFVVRVQRPDGEVEEIRARAVVDASGTWSGRNPLGGSGLPAIGEEAAAAFVTGPLPDVLGRDRERFAGRRTVVVGAGHSAANTLLNLSRLAAQEPGTEVLWAIRGSSPARVYGGGAADELAARGRLGSDLRAMVEEGHVELITDFTVTALEQDGDAVTLVGASAADGGVRRLAGVHTVVAATGFRPDLGILSEVQLDMDAALEAPARLAPLIDPQFHSCGTVPPHGHRDLAQPDEGLYVVGMKSYGRAPTFLITTGNEQERSVVAAIAGDLEAADRVQLVLPETGVCSVDAAGVDQGGAGCCGSAAAAPSDPHHRERPAGVPAQGFVTGLAASGTPVLTLASPRPTTPCCP